MCFGAEEGLDWRLDPEERRVEGRRGIGVGSGDMSIVHPGDGWSNDVCILIFLYFCFNCTIKKKKKRFAWSVVFILFKAFLQLLQDLPRRVPDLAQPCVWENVENTIEIHIEKL